MDMQSAIRRVVEHQNLSGDEMRAVMRIVMTGEATPAQIGGFLVGLRMKGETVDEIAAAAQVMRELATPVHAPGAHVVDIVGTGGDVSGSFNVSTAASMVVAAAGGTVAKHGNRAVSGKTGAADVLEAAGVRLDLTPAQVEQCLAEVGLAFLFAPQYHGAMKHAIGPRREMAVRTIFNVLGPLTNPAGAPHELMGVFSPALVEPLAEVLLRLGCRHVLVVHGEDGLDEISIGAPTRVAEGRDGQVRSYTIAPEDFGLTRAPLERIRVGSPAESLAVIRRVLADEAGPARDIVVLNAGAAIHVAGLAATLAEGVARAQAVIASGAAAGKFDQLVSCTRRLRDTE